MFKNAVIVVDMLWRLSAIVYDLFAEQALEKIRQNVYNFNLDLNAQ